MIFTVHFLRIGGRSSRPSIQRSAEFEADELYSVVSRTRIILGSMDYDVRVDAFQILVGTHVVYQERRDGVSQCGLDAPTAALGPSDEHNDFTVSRPA